MEKKRELIKVKAERQLSNKNHREPREEITASIENGQIKEIWRSRIWEENGRISSMWEDDRYTPEKSPFEFRTNLYEMLDIWKENKNKEEQSTFVVSISQEEIEKYFGKYGKPSSFYISERREGYHPRYFYIRILDGKIFDIQETIQFRSRSETKIITGDKIEKYLTEVIEVLIYKNGKKEYKRFLACLCEEELEKYFEPSYFPR